MYYERLLSLIVFFAVCAVAGTFLQRRVGAQSSQDESQIRDNLKSFTDVYAIVEGKRKVVERGKNADAFDENTRLVIPVIIRHHAERVVFIYAKLHMS